MMLNEHVVAWWGMCFTASILNCLISCPLAYHLVLWSVGNQISLMKLVILNSLLCLKFDLYTMQ